MSAVPRNPLAAAPFTRRRALSAIGAALLSAPWLTACKGEVPAPPPPASPELIAETSFALPRLDAAGTPLGPALCLGLPAVRALVAQPAMAIEEAGFQLQTGPLAEHLNQAARALLGTHGKDEAGSSSLSSAIAALTGLGAKHEADWRLAVQQVQRATARATAAADTPAPSVEDEAARLAGAGVQRLGNVLGFMFDRLSIGWQALPSGVRRPARDGDALLYEAGALDALAAQAVGHVTLEFVGQPTASILGRLLELWGPPQIKDYEDLSEPQASVGPDGRPVAPGIQPHLAACAWVRGHETLAFLPYSETDSGLRLMYTADANEKGWFKQPLPLSVAGAHGAPPSPADRMRQLAV